MRTHDRVMIKEEQSDPRIVSFRNTNEHALIRHVKFILSLRDDKHDSKIIVTAFLGKNTLSSECGISYREVENLFSEFAEKGNISEDELNSIRTEIIRAQDALLLSKNQKLKWQK